MTETKLIVFFLDTVINVKIRSFSVFFELFNVSFYNHETLFFRQI